MAKQQTRRLQEWIYSVWVLQGQLTKWAEGWDTKIISKKLLEKKFGEYRIPGLILQHDQVKLILEPIGRYITGTGDGSCELYRMPRHDNICNLYFNQGRWYLTISDAIRLKLNKRNFQSVLSKLNQPWPDLVINDVIYRDNAFYNVSRNSVKPSP